MKKSELDNIPVRFKWALDLIQPRPSDKIAEIGCGAGILTALIAAELKTGRITAIDRSPSMIHTAKKRNAQFITNKRAAFVETSLEEWRPRTSFDTVIAFNVSMFWKYPLQSLPLVKQLLKTNGRFFAFYQPPTNTTRDDAQTITGIFERNGLFIEDVLIKKMSPVPACCFITTFIKITPT